MKLEILYFDGCPNHDEAERRVREALADLGETAPIERIAARDDEMAARVRFLGSPSIRIDGRDVVPEEGAGPYVLRCRVYPTSAGLAGVPDKEAIRNAIQRGTP
jgi:hypothetical protein